MRRAKPSGMPRLEIFIYVVAAVLAYSCLMWRVMTLAETSGNTAPNWSSPSVMALKQIAPTTTSQSEPFILDNLDCSLITYRLATTSTMSTGCFTETAFGLMDSDDRVIIFNGTDEGLALLSFANNQVLSPWPNSGELVSLDPVNTGGTYLSLYKNPVGAMRDQRDLLLRIYAKQLVTSPDLQLKDKLGQRLVIEPQSLAFSDGGSWLVAEDYNGSFVRINLATLEIKAFAPSFANPGSPSLPKTRLSISGDGRFAAIYSDFAESFKVYDLTKCAGSTTNLEPEVCQSYDYLPFVRGQISGLRSVRHVRFVNDGLLSFEANSSVAGKSGLYEVAPASGIDSLIDYLGMGDSYTSGEGAFDYLAGTDLANNMCHLSINSYPLLLTHDLFSSRGGHSVACSGAVINDIANTTDGYRGQIRDAPNFKQLRDSQTALYNAVLANFVPGYLAQQHFLNYYQPAISTVSVGGDDIGFGDILRRCVMAKASPHHSDNDCFNTYEDRLEILNTIDRTVPRWVSMYRHMKAASPVSRLYAVGYPQVASDVGSCGLNVQLSKGELEFSIELIDYLNDAMRKSADQAGVTYVDISQALVGHRLCEAASYNVAVNGLTAGTDAGVLGKESYHPNILGQRLIEQEILKQTHHLTASTNNRPSSDPAAKILSAPKTGRKVRVRSQVNDLSSGVIKRGSSLRITSTGTKHGLTRDSVYTVHIDGSNSPAVATLISNSSGDINGSVTLPGSTSSGDHTLDVTGPNESGDEVDITQPIYVPSSDNDTDGDGILNPDDSCPAFINSGVDEDGDNIDDVCDRLIARATSGGGAGTTSGNMRAAAATSVAPASRGRSSASSHKSVSNRSGAVFPTSASKRLPSHKTAALKAKLKLNWLLWGSLALLIWLILIVIISALSKKFGDVVMFRIQLRS